MLVRQGSPFMQEAAIRCYAVGRTSVYGIKNRKSGNIAAALTGQFFVSYFVFYSISYSTQTLPAAGVSSSMA